MSPWHRPNAFKRIAALLCGEANRTPPSAPHEQHPIHRRHQLEIGGLCYDELRYPPYDKGLPLSSVALLIEGQSDLIERIDRASGIGAEQFDRQILRPIHRLARYLHLLPATSTSHFRGAGGLLRLSLEVGLFSLQGANAAVFPIPGGVERRYYVQPQWCIATFLAGICSQLYRTLSHMAVVSDKGDMWPSLTVPLYDWGKSLDIKRYYVRWLGDPARAEGYAGGAFLVSQIVPAAVLQELSENNHQVVAAMAGAVAGVDAAVRDNPIARIVAPVVTRVIEKDLQKAAVHYRKLTIGSHVEPYIVEQMRQLVTDELWLPNRDGSPLWAGTDGTFLCWTAAAAGLVNALSEDGFAGIPKDPHILADTLLHAGILQWHGSARYWTIVQPDTGELIDGCVKLSDPDFLFAAPDQQCPERKWALDAESLSARGSVTAPHRAAPAMDIRQMNFVLPTPEAPQSASRGDNQRRPDETASAARGNPKSAEEAVGEAGPDAGDSTALLASLRKEHAWLLKEIVDAWREGRLTGTVMMLPHGVAISQDELLSHCKQVSDFVAVLKGRQWLWVDTTRPNRTIHKFRGEKGEVCGIVLRADIACKLGFGAGAAA